ncbi:hypothetical protein AB0M29_27765 [Streptomyces sp. NPDC051976]|uniref:hypothetical protein n=1 Tax=Streptomyces sp. NPDC051976 TaxID=3154947 RepID=UPI0034174B59
MHGHRKLVWLGLTPEPERELPRAVAALRTPPPGAAPVTAADEGRRIERLVLHGSQRAWLRYLSEVTALVAAVATGTAPGDPRTALLAGEVVLSHHQMLIGLPGPGYDRAAADRTAAATAVRALRERLAAPAPDGFGDRTASAGDQPQPSTRRGER